MFRLALRSGNVLRRDAGINIFRSVYNPRWSKPISTKLQPLTRINAFPHKMAPLRLYSTNSEKEQQSKLPPKPTQPQRSPRVTKEQLLASANNFISRLGIRIKWLMKKSNRPFNTDDYSAMFSWLVMGNALLFILGTTTFFSLVILTFQYCICPGICGSKIG
ncbi:hypothetical protein PGUG_04744 [Meyerozyma guilliermondii ATCC 6260]|uniref:Uncharacterized protein n=1 Tax=Meyerozyma guilliermondii (strain ATCC 6260 / CBS 566 / DSM 6381 / JCM 1539 / NBRC 10279 / NRRL Y-324) TaxID=294746 RepID=A5DN93_PICGU|nr:uncharacterized protein PGUG_04744 [Meyerozyma guilliermondii ATCC 6260]EDK40646.2 hypothetical protein PGUG_04744 [Meyerozyma guilliermondii ATCC 6260]